MHVEVCIADINGVASDRDGARLLIMLEVDAKHAARNVAAFLRGLPPPVMRAAYDGLFTDENVSLRAIAQDSLQALQAEEDAQAERDAEEAERKEAIAQGPHGNCGGPCCAEG